jgi:RNA 2',3'-cyclic 3'-phosphodiesterase
MRLFIALDIPEEIRARLTEFVDHVRLLAPDARWTKPESLHVTLKFIGELKEERLDEIKQSLTSIKAKPFEVKFEGIGYFPPNRSPRVFWAGVHATNDLPQLATAIDQKLAQLGIEREEKAYHPHLTLARAGSGPGASRVFRRLQEQLATEEPPHFGRMTAHEFYLYQSRLSRGGAHYAKLERFSLN